MKRFEEKKKPYRLTHVTPPKPSLHTLTELGLTSLPPEAEALQSDLNL